MSASKSSNPCKTCRLRHVKCDTSQPTCSNCARAGIECDRGYKVRFRHTLNPSLNSSGDGSTPGTMSFASDQPWPRVMLPLCFVDENQHGNWIEPEFEIGDDRVESQSESPRGTEAASTSSAASPVRAHSKSGPGGPELPGFSPHSDMVSPLTSMMLQNAPACITPSSNHPIIPIFESTADHDNEHEVPSDLAKIFTTTQLWPQENYQVASLLRYYVENIAPMFDLCDNARHFARIVPQRAAYCPSLFNAILCVSSKRLNKIGDYDGQTAEHYQQLCLEHLIPALSRPDAAMDENLLAAIVILRYVEEMGMPTSGEVTESHLLGARAFLASQNGLVLASLRLSAFWIAMRQEIYMGFVHNRTVDNSFFIDGLGTLLQPVDNDCNYANRIIFHCLTCLKYCYGDEERSIAKWESLNACLESLWREKPQCFEPLWASWSDGRFFPELWYLNDAVITGIQHYHLARVLLSAFNPKIPKLGPRQNMMLKALEEEMKTTVREVCGVAISNPSMPPNFVTASIAITMAGGRFTQREEQQQLHDFLVKTDTEFGWPTTTARFHLQEAWGWTDSPISAT